MRKTTAWGTAIVMTTALVASCGSPEARQAQQGATPTQQQNVTELSLYSSFNKGTPLGALQEQVLADFTKETGIKVTVSDAVGDNSMQAYEAAVAAGKEADLVIINPADQSREWVKKKAVVPADEYLKSWGIADKLTPDALEGWRDSDGKLLGLPYIGFQWPVYWNMKILKQAGVATPPATEAEMLSAVDKLKASGTPLMVTGGGDWTGQALYTHIVQSYVPAETMKKIWRQGGYCASPEVRKGIQYFIKLRDAGVFAKNTSGYMMDQQNQLFFTGKAAAMSGGSWWFEDVPKAMRQDVVLGGVPVPSDGAYKKPMAAKGSTSNGFWISPKGAQKADAVRKLVEKFYSPQVASKVTTDTASTTTVKLDPPPATTNPLLQQAMTDWPGKVDFLPMVDFEMPAKVVAKNPGQTAQAYSADATVDSICKAYDDAY